MGHKQRVVIIGPGIMPIPPPNGWGAVESLVWDYKLFMDKYHGDKFETHVVNLPHTDQIIEATNALTPDIVHIQYDNHANVAFKLKCKRIFLTSHYAYIDSMRYRPNDGYVWHINQFVAAAQAGHIIMALSPSIAQVYVSSGAPEENVWIQHNGANDEVFRYTPTPTLPHKSVYLAKIDDRKRQHMYQTLSNLDFVGNIADWRFVPNSNYLGEWPKYILYENLTNYANLILLSDGEAHPLVCCEALVCGLGLVISEFATANLDTTLPFIDVIPNSRLNDLAYIEEVIKKNRETCLSMRQEIRDYGIRTFSWRNVVNHYVRLLEKGR